MNRRPDLPSDPAAVLEALRVARKAMIDVVRQVRPTSPVHRGASMVIAAIDDLATVLTGERDFFAIGGSVGPDRAEAVRARRRELDGN